jgi:hypothetical protein
MPYILPFQNGNKVRLNRMEKQFIYSSFTLPNSLKEETGVSEHKKCNVLLCESDIKEGQYLYGHDKYNIIWLDFPEECISNTVDFSIRDFRDFGIPPMILIRKHKSS